MTDINYRLLKELDEKYGSPFYIMSPDKYRKNINEFINAFKIKYDKVLAGYSFKTNYVPALCNIAREEGCLAEVVSDMELALAKKLGFDKIIFNGPIKREDVLYDAIDRGVVINLDSEYEVDSVCRYKQLYPEKDISLGIRININLADDNGNSAIQCGLRFGRFGFPEEVIGENIIKLSKLGVKIISLHGHTSTSDRAVLNYKVITQYMLSICEKYQLIDLQYFNIGGGYFGAPPEGMNISGRPKYEDYANCILGEVMANNWFMTRRPYIVIEPGSSVVSNVFTYYTKVYQKKTIGEVNFIIVDGTIYDIKPTMHQNILPHDVFRTSSDNTELCEYDIVGSTCMEKDVMLKGVSLPRLKAGDFIQFRGVGAYTISLTPNFINFLPPIIMEKEDDFVEVRRRQNLDDLLTIYKY